MKNLLLLFFLTYFPMNMYSQEKEEKIKWQENRPLTWDDFKAIPDGPTEYSANTNSGISYSWSYSTASGEPVLTYEIFSNFYPQLSWVREIHDEEYLLAHEQLHFDISELHARKLRKAMGEYEIGRNIRQDLKSIYAKIEKDRVQMQNRFDRETAHSENKEAEMRWREFIATELIKYREFSN